MAILILSSCQYSNTGNKNTVKPTAPDLMENDVENVLSEVLNENYDKFTNVVKYIEITQEIEHIYGDKDIEAVNYINAINNDKIEISDTNVKEQINSIIKDLNFKSILETENDIYFTSGYSSTEYNGLTYSGIDYCLIYVKDGGKPEYDLPYEWIKGNWYFMAIERV